MKNLWTKLNKSNVEAPSKGVKAYYAVLAAALVMLSTFATQVSALQNIANTFKNTFEEIYSVIISVVTIIAVVLIAICLVIRMVSKNPRSAEEATSWIKRIIITWLCLMLLSLFLTYGLDIVTQSGADTVSPWN